MLNSILNRRKSEFNLFFIFARKHITYEKYKQKIGFHKSYLNLIS
jgi:hypothetical protein